MTSPEVSLDTLERVLERQGGIPMTPRDRDMMETAIRDMRHWLIARRRRDEPVRTAPILQVRRASA